MTRMQAENSRILDALQEGKVQAVIALLEKNFLSVVQSEGFAESVRHVLEIGLEMKAEDIDYWMGFYNIGVESS